MYCLDPKDEWSLIHNSDLWIYNKLFLSRVLGYNCGPTGVSVPKPDFYIVRPMVNLLGMGRFARKEWIENSTDHIHPSEFWCEIFTGDHISVDFENKVQKLCVLGTRNEEDPLYKWKKWEKINKIVDFPLILNNLHGEYEHINCEFIGNNLIEVHFRENPDFRYENSVAIPVWEENDINFDGKYKYVEDLDYKRKGFLVDITNARDRNPVKSSDFLKSGEKNGPKNAKRNK